MESFLPNNDLPETSIDSSEDDGLWNPIGSISIINEDSKMISDVNTNSITNLSSYTDPHNIINPSLPVDIKADEIISKFANMFKKQQTEEVKQKRQKPMESYTKPTREDYGLNINRLKKWNEKMILMKTLEDENRQELALSKVKRFMDAIFIIIKLQSWWRMHREMMRYEVWRAERRKIKRLYYEAWKRQVKAEKSYLYQILGKPFEAWATEVQDAKNLRVLVRDFFLLCIKRLKLTPQAVMAYFSPQEWGAAISEGDQNKIRRLVLSKLFHGWRTEVRFLRNNRFKASQILTRVMRRSKGPLWVKETTLVCFHVWRRYGSVRKAYKLQLPEPRFGAPYLPQWTKLLQTITLQRISRKRAAEKAEMLVYIRTFRRWTFIMTVDRTQSANPEAVAESHNRRVILRRVVLAWRTVLRERGTIVRVRDRCFFNWKKWAPIRSRMSSLKKQTKIWLDARRTYNAFYAMQVQCFELISRVISKVQLLNAKCLDRKVIMCAYALLNRDACVIALDCWRRWKLYWQGRVRWRKAQLQYNYMWHSGRIKVLFNSWKYFVDMKMGNSRPSTREINERNKRISMKLIGIDSYEYSDDAEKKEKVDENIPITINEMQGGFIMDNNSIENDSRVSIDSRNSYRSDIVSPFSSTTRIAIQLDDETPLVPGISQHAYNHFENMKNTIVTDAKLPLRKMYHLFYHCLARAHKRQAKQRKDSNTPLSNTSDDLKVAIDRLDVDEAIHLVEKGATVETSHIQQVAKYLGDEHIPLFCYLVSKCPSYMAERIVKADKHGELNHCSNPINALALASHIKRWENCQLSRRELTIFEDTGMNEELCGSYNSVILWRSIVMLLTRKRADDIQSTCVVLPESRTVEKEVVEALKRKKLFRLRTVREGLRNILHLREDRASQLLKEIPPLVMAGPKTTPDSEIEDWIKELDINGLLHEYANIKGKLSEEVRALRMPLVHRDDKLIENGKLKQARADFLALRRSCMTPAELRKEQKKINDKKHKEHKEEREKQYKEAMIRRKLKNDADKKAKKAARAAAIAKKKVDKARKKAGLPALVEEQKPEVDEQKDKMDDIVAGLLADEYDSAEDDAVIALHTLQEEDDIRREELFQSRTGYIGHFIFETWISPTKRDSEENLEILKERADTEASDASKRLIKMIRDGGINITNNKRTIEGHGGIGGWLVSSSFNHPKIMNDSIFKGLVPLSWWNVPLLFERTKKEITLVEAYIFVLEAKFDNNYKEDDTIDMANNKLKSFLKSTREEVLQIAKKKNKKVESEIAERAKKSRSLERLTKQIDDIIKRIKMTNEKIKKAEIMVATSNIEGVYTVFNTEPTNVDDKEQFRFMAYELIEKNKRLIGELNDRIKETNDEIATVKHEIYSFESFCERGTNMLRDLAESKFSTMLEVQQIVNRSSKRQYTLRADSTIEFKSLTKIKKYLSILKSFLSIINRYQNRAQVLDEKSESLVFDSVDSIESGSLVDFSTIITFNNDNDSINNNEYSHSHKRPMIVDIINDDSASIMRSPIHMEIENLWPGNETFTGLRPLSPEAMNDDIDDHNEENDHFDDSSTLQGGSQSNGSINTVTSVKRRLSKQEQYDLEKQIAAIAAENAEIAETNELRARTFDEYWIAVVPPKKKKKEKPEKIKKKKEVVVKEEDISTSLPESQEPLVIVGKTTSLWKNVGSAYRRERKDRVLTELDPDFESTASDAKVMYKTRLLPVNMDYDEPVWQAKIPHKLSVSMSASEHPDLLEEMSKKSSGKFTKGKRNKDITIKDPFVVMGINEYERVKINFISKYNEKLQGGGESTTSNSIASYFAKENGDDAESSRDEDERSEDNDNDKDNNQNEIQDMIDDTNIIIGSNNDDDDDDKQGEASFIYLDSANNNANTFTDTLTNIDVTAVIEKPADVPYQLSSSSSSSLLVVKQQQQQWQPQIVSSSSLPSLPAQREASSTTTINISSNNASTIIVCDNTSNNINAQTITIENKVDAIDVLNAKPLMNDSDIRIESAVPIVNINTGISTSTNTNTNTNSIKALLIDTNIEVKEKINDSDSECPSPMVVSAVNPKVGLEQLAEKTSINAVNNKYNNKTDADSDLSDHDDDERSMPVPISFVSVSQVSGEIVATKGDPSIIFSTDGGLAEGNKIKSVKFDQSVDKNIVESSSSFSKPSTVKAKDDLKWHLSDQPKASIAKPEDILVLGSCLFESSLEDNHKYEVMEQPRVMTPGSSLSERLGLSSASSPMGPHGLNEDSTHSPLLRTPGGSLISAIQDSIRQMSEGSLKASQDILDKISIDDNDDDDDDNYITLTMNDLNKAPISIEGAHSRPLTQYMPGGGSVTLDLNKVANAIDILKHEYHDNPASFANRVIPITNKNEIAEKIRNAKAKKMPIADKRSNPQYIKLNGYNAAYDFNVFQVGDVIPNDYSKKTRLRAFKKNQEETEQARRAQEAHELLGRPVKTQPKASQKKGPGGHHHLNMNNMDLFDTTINEPAEIYVNQLLHNCDDDVLKLAYSVVLGLDRTSNTNTNSNNNNNNNTKFAEGLTKAPIDNSRLDIDIDNDNKQIYETEINDSLSLSLSLSSSNPNNGNHDDIVFDDFFNYRSSLRTPIISLRDYAKSRQDSRGHVSININNDDKDGVSIPSSLLPSSSLPSSPNYDRYLLRSRQTPLALEPLRSQPLIPLTFGLDNDDEANLENELRAMLRHSSSNTKTNSNIDVNNKNDTESMSMLPPLKKDYNSSNSNSRVKITKGTLLRSLSLAAPISSIDNNTMMVNGHIPKVKKGNRNYVNSNTLKPLVSQSLALSSSSSSSSKRILKSDITINTSNSHTFNDVLENMSARVSFSSIASNDHSLHKSSFASTDMKVEIKKKKDKDIDKIQFEKNNNDDKTNANSNANDNTDTDMSNTEIDTNSNKKRKKTKKIKQRK